MADGGIIGTVATSKKSKAKDPGPSNFDRHRDAYMLIRNGNPAGLEALRAIGHDVDMAEAADMALVWEFATYGLLGMPADAKSKAKRREQLQRLAAVLRGTADHNERLARLYEAADLVWLNRNQLSDIEARTVIARALAQLAWLIDPCFANADPAAAVVALRRVRGAPALAENLADLAKFRGRGGTKITRQAIITAASRRKPHLVSPFSGRMVRLTKHE